LERLHTTLELLSRDFGTTNPLTDSKKVDPELIAKAEKVSARAPQIARMKRFLVNLPADPDFDRLRFLQSLVVQNLSFPKIFERPELVDAVALQAFENYHLEYSQKYLDLLANREKSIENWEKKRKIIAQKLFTLESLDTVKKLGEKLALNLSAEFAELETRNRPLGVKIVDLRKILRIEPTVAGITFFTPLPDREFSDFEKRLDGALARKFEIIREKSVLAVLRNSKNESVKKLTELIALADLEKIVRLFTPKSAEKITSELSKNLL
jgi:hypothetical protein